MQGYRKLLVAVAAMAIAALVQITDSQADVLIAVVYATMGANGLVHAARSIGDGLKFRNGNPGSSGSDSGMVGTAPKAESE